MDINEIVKKAESLSWAYLVRRTERVLQSAITTGSEVHFMETTGIPVATKNAMRLDGVHLMFEESILAGIGAHFSQVSLDVFRSFDALLIERFTTLIDYVESIRQIDPSTLSEAELADYIEEYVSIMRRATNFLLPMPIADKVLTKKIHDLIPDEVADKDALAAVLTAASEENEHAHEERSFYPIVQKYLEGKDVSTELKAHLALFSWTGARYEWENVWTEKSLLQRLEHWKTSGKDPMKEMAHLDEVAIEKENSRREALDTWGTPDLEEVCTIGQRYAYLRTYRTDMIYRSAYFTSPFFLEASRRIGLTNELDCMWSTPEEILNCLRGKMNSLDLVAEVAKRKEYYTTLLLDGQYYILSGQQARIALSALRTKYIPSGEGITEIKGIAAFKGIIRGVAKIVLDTNEMDKVQPGDILVATMTFPHLIPAMERAAAFVTDEGGILCHAAIVAREMRKPCIIGTKRATLVFKDGDMIEVNADKGIVRTII